ncbi:MAG: hypothetical protein H7X95_09240, partial [Deltaproteobacteria bacterium]|nr:hypothetical protein [Deltaproteobacteria bacterium]
MFSRSYLLLVLVAVFSAAGGCAKVEQKSIGGTGGVGGSGPMRGTAGNTPPIATPGSCTACEDFPSTPIIDPSAPANAPSMFTGAPSGAEGPCVVEPEDDTLFPK